MKKLLLLLLCLSAKKNFAQDISASLQSKVYDRYEDLNTNTSIPYKGGVVEVYCKGKFPSHTIMLRKISSTGILENEMDIGFGTEHHVSLIGLLAINNQPVIFYTTNKPSEPLIDYPVYIKAAVLDFETLKVTKKVELKKINLQKNSDFRDKFNEHDNFQQREHNIKIKYSAGKDKYVMLFPDKSPASPVTEYYVWIFDESLNIVYDKQEIIDNAKVKLVDFLMCENNFYLMYQTGQACIKKAHDYLEEAYYCDRFSTLVRKTDVATGSSSDISFINEPGYIKMARLFYNPKSKGVNVGGLYSKDWNSYATGSFWSEENTNEKKIVTIKKSDFKGENYLTEQFNNYKGRADDIKKETTETKCDCCRYKLTSLFAETAGSGRSDMVFEWKCPCNQRYGLLITVTITPQGEVINNFITKPQKLPLLGPYPAGASFFSTGAYACYNKKDLLLFYNDNLLNQNSTGVPEMMQFDNKTNWGLFELPIDEKGKQGSKVLLLDNTPDKYFSETGHFWNGNNGYLYFPASNVKKGYDEFRLGVISLN